MSQNVFEKFNQMYKEKFNQMYKEIKKLKYINWRSVLVPSEWSLQFIHKTICLLLLTFGGKTVQGQIIWRE